MSRFFKMHCSKTAVTALASMASVGLATSSLATSSLATSSLAIENDEVFLFPYFDSNGENGVYMAYSDDGKTFHSVNNGDPIFTPPTNWHDGVTNQNLTRDPSIVYHDGTYHMVWTSNWTGTAFGYASSTDLMNWSTPQMITPFANQSEQPKNVWAPELLYDHINDDFKIVWASTMESELNDGDGSNTNAYDHRQFFVTTNDFQTFTDPSWFFGQQFSVIDGMATFDDRGTANEDDDRWVMVVKNEQYQEDGGKNLRLTFTDADLSNFVYNEWSPASDPIVGPGAETGLSTRWAEGQTLIKDGDQWLLYWDDYGAQYRMAVSDDLENWTELSDELKFYDENGNRIWHPRHGTVFVTDRSNVYFDEVPEPGTSSLLLGGLSVAGLRRRSRMSRI